MPLSPVPHLSAAKLGNLDEVRNLLQSESNFDLHDDDLGNTALDLASTYGSVNEKKMWVASVAPIARPSS